MRFNKLLLIALLFLLLPLHLLAWGREGHQIVAKLAMLQLSDVTKQKVLKVLGTMTPEEAGTWMDDIRGDAAYKYTTPWHYTNIEKGAIYQPAPSGDIITALKTAYKELENMDTLSPERLRFDVLVLFHLCGDLQQPLHVGYGSDKGGNTYQVQYNGKGTNLHHIWDSEIIESQGVTAAALEPKTKPTKESIDKLRNGPVDFNFWLQESRARLPYVYEVSGHKLDDSYLIRNKKYVEEQLQVGGNMLATLLEHVFSQAKNIPVDNAAASTKQQTKGYTVQQELLANVPADQAADYIAKKVAVCGKVYSTKFQGGSSVTFINMGGEYPNNPFTAVIIANNRSNFNYKPEDYLNGKTICVVGTVKDYKGKPEIVVENQEQISVQ